MSAFMHVPLASGYLAVVWQTYPSGHFIPVIPPHIICASVGEIGCTGDGDIKGVGVSFFCKRVSTCFCKRIFWYASTVVLMPKTVITSDSISVTMGKCLDVISFGTGAYGGGPKSIWFEL